MINIIIINTYNNDYMIYIWRIWYKYRAKKGSLADSTLSIGNLEILDSYYLYNFFYVS